MSILTSKSNNWFICPNPNPRARLRLFCFPYAGAGASIFVSWATILPPTIELYALQLPGRETRIAEHPFTQLEQLITALAPVIRPYLDRPFAFFGHSMGALIGFELTRYFQRAHKPLPDVLFVSAHRAAHLRDRRPPAHMLPELELLAELRRLNGTPKEVLDHPELQQLLLPILRADFALCENYIYTEEPPLECPIVGLGGLQDTHISREEIAAWRELTNVAFTMRMFAGDHFFLHTERSLLLQSLARELMQLIGS